MNLLESIETAKGCKFEDYFTKYPLLPGLIMEFGVATGGSINRIADLIAPRKVFGFDSFEGMPEDWHCQKKGDFKVDDYKKLSFRDNVTIMPGWFDVKIPNFFKFHKREKIALIHVDCDIYSSTKTVFDNCKDRFQNGTILIFDEIYGYKGYEDHEFRVFNDFLKESQYKFDCIGSYEHAKYGFRIWKDWEYEPKHK